MSDLSQMRINFILPFSLQQAYFDLKQSNFIRRRSDYIIGFVTPAIGPNKFKKVTRLIAPVHNIRGKV